MSANFINNGIKLIKEANEADEKTAYNKYSLAAQNFLTGLKYEKSDKIKKTLLDKAEKYISRAEIVKGLMKSENKKVQNEGDIPDHKDDEKTKMENSMSNAIIVENPNVKWDDVAGLEKAKAMLKEAVILPIKFPDMFTGKRKPWRGILLYGPPGTGKSFLAKAVATEAGNSTFFSVSSSDLVSKYLGESEKLARKSSPAIIFIDEIDSLCGSRSDGEHDATRRIKTEFLVQMQGMRPSDAKVLVLGATNTPWQLDPAIRRRFEKRVFIALPEPPARERMFRLMVGDTPNELSRADYAELAGKTEGFSGSDIDSFTRDALYEPVRLILQSQHFKQCIDENTNEKYYLPCSVGDPKAQKIDIMSLPQNAVRPRKLRLIDFLRVLPNATRSVSAKDLDRYTEWTEEYGTEG